jgi:hypothetical protein
MLMWSKVKEPGKRNKYHSKILRKSKMLNNLSVTKSNPRITYLKGQNFLEEGQAFNDDIFKVRRTRREMIRSRMGRY